MGKDKEVENLDSDLVLTLENVLYQIDDVHCCIDFCEIKPIFKEKEIENDTYAELFARYLQSKGYGNVKQAVEEFAEKLKDRYWEVYPDEQMFIGDLHDSIDDLIKELYGAESED